MKKLLLKVKLFFITIMGNPKAFEKFLVDHVDDGIDIVDMLRRGINSPFVLLLSAVLPPRLQTLSLAIRQRSMEILDEVTKNILAGEDILNMTKEARFAALVDYLKKLSPTMRDAASLKIASLYALKSSGETLKQSIVDTAVQNRFIERSEKIV